MTFPHLPARSCVGVSLEKEYKELMNALSRQIKDFLEIKVLEQTCRIV